MSTFSDSVVTYWHAVFANGELIQSGRDLSITLNPSLGRERRVMLLEDADGRVKATLTPAVAKRIALDRVAGLSATELRERLASSGISLHDPDFVFYLPKAAQPPKDGLARAPRQLADADRDAFNAFQVQASKRDLEDAYVELDHWSAFGAFDEARLVCAASMYPWDGARIADLGVLTLPSFRRKGHARAVVRAISWYARGRGYEPQYRCQLDNQASVSLARASGFSLFGRWEVIASAPIGDDAS